MQVSLYATNIKLVQVMQETCVRIMRSNLCELVTLTHNVQASILSKAFEAVFAQNEFMRDCGYERTVRRITFFKLHTSAS